MKKLILVSLGAIILSVLGFVAFTQSALAEEKTVPYRLSSAVSGEKPLGSSTNVLSQQTFFISASVLTNQAVYSVLYATTKFRELGQLVRVPPKKVTNLDKLCDFFSYEGASGDFFVGRNWIQEDCLTMGKGINWRSVNFNGQLRWAYPSGDAGPNYNRFFCGFIAKTTF